MNFEWRMPALAAFALFIIFAFSGLSYAQACSVDGEQCVTQACCPGLQLGCDINTNTCRYIGCSLIGDECSSDADCCPNMRLGCDLSSPDPETGKGQCVAKECELRDGGCTVDSDCCTDLGLKCSDANECEYIWQPVWDSWRTIAVVLLVMMMLSIALAYMLSTALQLDGLKHWAAAEFMQAGASAIMILGLILLIDLLTTVSSPVILAMATNAGLAGPDGLLTDEQASNPLLVANYYLKGSVQCLQKYYRWISFVGSGFEAVGSMVLPAQGMDDMANIGLSPLAQIAHVICHNITFMLIAQYFQLHLLDFISYATVGYLLPLGIVLRILPFTRGLGSFFIALSIGLYYIYPTMYVLVLTVMPRAQCAVVLPDSECDYNDPAKLANCCFDNPVALSKTMEFQKSKEKYTENIGFFKNIQNEINLLMLQGFVYPMVNLTITFTFVRALMQLMGLDMAEVGQGLIKLI